jgi:signal transduction histidine kinase
MMMGRDPLKIALDGLKAQTESSRLAAARAILRLMGDLTEEIETAVRVALAKESVPWVRGALAEVLARGEAAAEYEIVISAPSWDERIETLDRDVARQVLNLSTRRVLHEVTSVVGRARLAASSEMGEAYTASETARQLTFLSEVCGGLRTLAVATQAPSDAEFDLSAAVQSLAASVRAELLCPVLATGPAPFMATTDRGLLLLAVRNVLVNAVEATLMIGPADESSAVVLTWGSSPDGAHVTVIDRGPGPPRFLAAVHRAGISTKEGHPGYGLATASEAMRTLGGEVTMQRNDRGGATVVLSWREDPI